MHIHTLNTAHYTSHMYAHAHICMHMHTRIHIGWRDGATLHTHVYNIHCTQAILTHTDMSLYTHNGSYTVITVCCIYV